MPANDIIKKKIGFSAGILLFIILLFLPIMNWQARAAMATLLLCAIWWATEAIPLAATALLPAVILPLLDVLSLQETLSQYAHRIIFLFFGGFVIARAMIKWGLDRRIAIAILSKSSDKSSTLILYFMIVTAILSAFISNTATTAMMLPIGMAVMLHIEMKEKQNYGKVLMLSIAYAATIGGVATLVGTPPNAIFAGFSETLLNKKITFSSWLTIGVPFAAIMLPTTWLFLIKKYHLHNVDVEKNFIEEEREKLGRMGREEKIVIFVFLLVAFLWISRPLWGYIPLDFAKTMQQKMDDALIAIFGAILLFTIPSSIKEWKPLLEWEDIKEIPFGILILFGGGLAVGKALFESGAAEFIAGRVEISQPLILLLFIITITSFLTEVASNTAVANMMMPILVAIASKTGMEAYALMIPATLACSLAFMFPISTPPNAIVYSSGYIKMEDMIKTGITLHIMGIAVIMFLSQILPQF
ncbi:MAG: DASS family sodium-coupled anion symporter [Thermoplasmata archaeon]|nr:DASS family sodium-coupled anion symporter [Thermoplasmata archaeon]